MNFAFAAFGLALAFVIGERLVAQAQRRSWAPVSEALRRRSIDAALDCLNGFASSPRILLQMTESMVTSPPGYLDMENDVDLARNFVQQHVVPAIKVYTSLRPPPNRTTDFIGFADEDWKAIQNGIEKSAERTTQLLMITGEHQGPAVMGAILELDVSLQRAVKLFERDRTGTSGAFEMQYLVALLKSLEQTAVAAAELLDRVAEK